MAFLRSLNRRLERNQVASMALLDYYEKSSINDIDDFNEDLWLSIANSRCKQWMLEIKINNEVPLEFIVKLFIKIGFNGEDAVRLMMSILKQGSLILAYAEEDKLLRLQKYISTQATTHSFTLGINIIKT